MDGHTDTELPAPALPKTRMGTAPGLLGLALIGAAFVVMAGLTWRKWPDAVIDFGTQLYIPWRLSEGAVLYRDLFYFAGGPLSQYFNAALFKIFGVSLSTLIVANLLLLILLLGYVYRRFLAAADALTATLIGLAIVVIFSFSEYVTVGNYNFITPYSHEAVHGTLLSLFGVGLLANWLGRPRILPLAMFGLCAGLVFMTKPDIFVALMASWVVAADLQWRWTGSRFTGKCLAVLPLTMAIGPLLFFLFFWRVEDWYSSLHSVVFGWLGVFNSEVRNNIFYVRFRGMDIPLVHLREMVIHFVCGGLVIAGYAGLFRALGRWKALRPGWRWGAWLLCVLPLVGASWAFPWTNSGSSLPFWCLTTLAVLVWLVRRGPAAREYVFPLLWTVFSLILMAKMGVNCRIWHCGFFLAMPAFVITLYFLLWLLPRLLEARFQAPSNFLRFALMLALLTGFLQLSLKSASYYDLKTEAIGHAGDRIYAFGPPAPEGQDIKQALAWLETRSPTNATLAVLPTGITLNYLSRRANSTPCLFWDPTSMAIWGQETMTRRFEEAPPDYVLLLDQSQLEVGVGNLGSFPGYGTDLMQWIKQHYQRVWLVGSVPLQNAGFGIEILERIPLSASQSPPTPPAL